jgi:competence protein ComEC
MHPVRGMRRLLIVGIVASLVLPLLGQGSASVRETAAPCLRVREAANPDAIEVTCLAPGTTVEVLRLAPYWREVRLSDGRTGWVAKKFLQVHSGPGLAPFLEVHFVDVGQGDAIWIHTADDGVHDGRFDGKNVVIDGGPDSADAKNALFQYIRSRAHHEAVIDALVVTHPHDDHYPGAETLLRHFEVRSFYDPGYETGSPSYAAFMRAVNAEPGIEVFRGRDVPARLELGSEVVAEFLYSYDGTQTGLGSGSTKTNNTSLVLRLQYGEHTFLFMGDAEGKNRADDPAVPKFAERLLLDTIEPERLRTTVLKIAHHGSETSSTLPFIRAVDPQVVVVQSGRRKYGQVFLPDDSTLRRYCCHNPAIRILRTDEGDAAAGRDTRNDADGDHVVIRTNGTELEVQAYRDGVPFTPAGCRPACVP